MASKKNELIPRGVLLFNILVEGKTPSDAATRVELDAWIGKANLPYSASLDSADPQPTLETFFNVPRDQFIIVDLKTMQFVDIFDANPMAAIAAVKALLPSVPDGGTPDM